MPDCAKGLDRHKIVNASIITNEAKWLNEHPYTQTNVFVDNSCGVDQVGKDPSLCPYYLCIPHFENWVSNSAYK